MFPIRVIVESPPLDLNRSDILLATESPVSEMRFSTALDCFRRQVPTSFWRSGSPHPMQNRVIAKMRQQFFIIVTAWKRGEGMSGFTLEDVRL